MRAPIARPISSDVSALASAGSSLGAATSAAKAGAAESRSDESPIREARARARRGIRGLQAAALTPPSNLERFDIATLTESPAPHNENSDASDAYLGRSGGTVCEAISVLHEQHKLLTTINFEKPTLPLGKKKAPALGRGSRRFPIRVIGSVQ